LTVLTVVPDAEVIQRGQALYLEFRLAPRVEALGMLDVFRRFTTPRACEDGSVDMLDQEGELLATAPESTWRMMSTKVARAFRRPRRPSTPKLELVGGDPQAASKPKAIENK
jgi:hypothetical protein